MRVQMYVDTWATATQNVVTKDRPHDDMTWEAYTLRTWTRVMYVPPHPPAPVPDTTRVKVHLGR
jgi:hypothetical protein